MQEGLTAIQTAFTGDTPLSTAISPNSEKTRRKAGSVISASDEAAKGCQIGAKEG